MRIPLLFLTTLQLASGQVILQNAKLSNAKLGQAAAAVIPPAGTAFVTGVTVGGGTVNSLDWEVGINITIGGADVTISQLGRYVISGNSLTHVLKIRNTSTTVLGSITVNTSGATTGQFLYGTLASPVTLTHGQTYYILSEEVSGGDFWADTSWSVTTTAVASITAAAHFASGSFADSGSADSDFGPVDFKYTSP